MTRTEGKLRWRDRLLMWLVRKIVGRPQDACEAGCQLIRPDMSEDEVIDRALDLHAESKPLYYHDGELISEAEFRQIIGDLDDDIDLEDMPELYKRGVR